ncbi:hypothetical protein F5141DRAFT_1138562 [Pisolithus sp. B1]|nr:hypothetical protein F5141DRAFT_1138562 [Pisolithus sp. B1]
MAANALWAHILPKVAIFQDSTLNPPMTPQDKTGTSMRMLVHDTQSTLERFSERLDVLMTRVDDCRSQVINANKLLDHERDKVLTEMADISCRSQNELKSHMGTPAQAHALELTHSSQVSTENSVRALEKRIDALQTVSPTATSAISVCESSTSQQLVQSHTGAFASIQDQQKAIQAHQSTLLDAVLPLLQLLQNLPSQFDQLKSSLTDVVSNVESNLGKDMDIIKDAIPRLTLNHAQQKLPVWSTAGPELTSKECNSTPGKRTNPWNEVEGASMATSSTDSPKRTRLSVAPERTFRTPRTPPTTSSERVSSAPRRFTVVNSRGTSRTRPYGHSTPRLRVSRPDAEKADSGRAVVLERNAPKETPNVIFISSSPLSDTTTPMPSHPSATVRAGSFPGNNGTGSQTQKNTRMRECFQNTPRVIPSPTSDRPSVQPLGSTLPVPSSSLAPNQQVDLPVRSSPYDCMLTLQDT